jgi:hypothetical protein
MIARARSVAGQGDTSPFSGTLCVPSGEEALGDAEALFRWSRRSKWDSPKGYYTFKISSAAYLLKKQRVTKMLMCVQICVREIVSIFNGTC